MSLLDLFRLRKQSAPNPVEMGKDADSTEASKKLPWWEALLGTFIVLKEPDVLIAIAQNAIG
jgi:hypothetical protein